MKNMEDGGFVEIDEGDVNMKGLPTSRGRPPTSIT